ncbi:meiosis regulator and mRNA stability factor 1-like [Cimex lectularius]|uniref:HTH OST-type domain-containing protein n=1 Tax=Cimex lectularius TaxID=79782 RepID=A0A8I6S8G4_CIMLE|nr:meiosis regulator and mRNA stability factor 1-like [Cimex lectularius]XP_024082048.1 meiosis regulator and mRNA stability factor 1-like [Cimex lectularius]
MEGEAILKKQKCITNQQIFDSISTEQNGVKAHLNSTAEEKTGKKAYSQTLWATSNEKCFGNGEKITNSGTISTLHTNFGNKENLSSFEPVKDEFSFPWDCCKMKDGQVLSAKNENRLSIEKISEQTSAFEQFMSHPNTMHFEKTFSDWNDSSSHVNIFSNGHSDEKSSFENISISNSTLLPSGKVSEGVWSGAKITVVPPRKCRTPSPYMFQSSLNSSQSSSNSKNRRTTFPLERTDSEKYFNPITSSNGNQPIELLVTNLDQNIDPTEIKKNLLLLFREHVMVLHISIFMLSDGNFAASVKVPSLHDAQYAISRLHRRKVGYKRLMISYAHSSHSQNPQFIRWQVVSLLRDVPHNKLPLFSFLELFESRYLTTVSVSELYRLKDICTITDENGRMVSLNLEYRKSPTPSPSLPYSNVIELHCSKHYKVKQGPGKGWAEQEVPPLPNVIVNLKQFSDHIYTLLKTHNNIVPLASFYDCYECEFGQLPISEGGVPLEHLVTCVNNVKLSSSSGVKYLEPTVTNQSEETTIEQDVKSSISPKLTNVLNIFSRELVDLLKSQPHSQVTFSRFIPAYHHYFGRQCRVADYGFTRLIDLLIALPNVVQVLGEGNRRIVTLSHRTQVRRFTSDLLRVLKVQPSKKILLSELPAAFHSVLSRPFDPIDYGLCYLSDLIDQVSENIVLLSQVGDDRVIYIPKREQTLQEIERTKAFSLEVIELLSHAPQCAIMFNKFIPAYHHHFGHQCRMMDFGFSKLVELFEAIPEIVKMEEDGKGERKVCLTYSQKLIVLSEQISGLVTPYYPPGLPLEYLLDIYIWKFGYALKTETYQASSLEELVSNITTVKIVHSDKGKIIIPVEEALVKHLTTTVMRILLDTAEGKITHSMLKTHFDSFHYEHIKPTNLVKLSPDIIKIHEENSETIIELMPLYQFARKLCDILVRNEGRILLYILESVYFRTYQTQLQPAHYGFSNIQSLLSAIPQVISLRGKGMKRLIILNRELMATRNKHTDMDAISCPPVPKDFSFSNGEDEDSKFNVTSPVKWNNPTQDPLIILPDMPVPPIDVSMFSLFSPCKNLLPPSARPCMPKGISFGQNTTSSKHTSNGPKGNNFTMPNQNHCYEGVNKKPINNNVEQTEQVSAGADYHFHI